MKSISLSCLVVLASFVSSVQAACFKHGQNSRDLLEYLVENPNSLEVRGRPEAMTIPRKRHLFRKRLDNDWFVFVYPHHAPRQDLVVQDRPLRVKRIRNYHERGYARAGTNDLQIKFEDPDLNVLLLHLPGQLTVAQFLRGLRHEELPLELKVTGIELRSDSASCTR